MTTKERLAKTAEAQKEYNGKEVTLHLGKKQFPITLKVVDTEVRHKHYWFRGVAIGQSHEPCWIQGSKI